jgi:microcystin-dependent protein
MSNPFVAEIRVFPFNFAPKGWAFCAGQLLPISQNTALFSLLGTTFGGDGTTASLTSDYRTCKAIFPSRSDRAPVSSFTIWAKVVGR